MRNAESWRPTKCVWDKSANRFVPRRGGVSLGSLFSANLAMEHYAPLIKAFSQGALLDCGCGTCPYYEMYKNQVTSVTCTDWPQSGHTARYVDTVADLNAALPFAAEVFDSVLLTDVLEHIAEPRQLMFEIARVLKPGAHVMIATPFFYWLHEEPHDYLRFTEHALRRYCADAGMTVVHLSRYGGLPDVFLDLINKGIARWSRLSRFFAAAANTLSRTSIHRKLRQRTEASFPLGYFTVARKPLDMA